MHTDDDARAAAPSLLAELGRRFTPAAADGMDAVFQYTVRGAPVLHFQVSGGSLHAAPGSHDAPHLTIDFASHDALRRAVHGELDVVAAFMAGELRASGHLVLAMRTLLFVFAPLRADGRAQLT
jgi:putative sterol carrier protein